LQINVTFDQDENSLPAGFVAAIDFVVNYYDSLFTNNVTINIHVGYGEVAGQTLGSNALGESYAPLYVPASYSSVRNALLAEGAPGASSLLASSPLPGSLYMPQAEAQALGLTASVSTSYVGFSSTAPFSYTPNATPASYQYYFIGVVEHEISEDMGRVSLLDQQPSFYSPMDVFRYSSPGVHDLSTGGSGSTAYFSTDNGVTNLGTWNNSTANGDLGDWYPSGPAAGGHDAFNDASSPGVINVVSPGDITLMNALGWGRGITGTGPSYTTVVTGDFTGNGKTDIAVIGFGLGGIGTYLSHGDGTFNGVFSPQTGSDWIDWPNAKVLTGDFSGNGQTDLAVVAGLFGIGTYLSNGDGTFHAVYSPQTGTDWIDWPHAKMVTGNFTSNGKTDIAVISGGLGGIGTYLSNGDGAFHTAYSSQTGSDWADWASIKPITGDFTGNGLTDIAVFGGLAGIGTYLSSGDGTFHAVYSPQPGTDWIDWPYAKMVTGNFTSNGKTDIAVISGGLGGIGTYLSNGDGTFHAVYSSQTGSDWADWPNAQVIAGHFTHDGLTDLAVIAGLGGIGTYLSNGDGTFHAMFSPQTGTDWIDRPNVKFVTGDFLGNGLTDIEVIDPTLGGIALYLSNGDGTFHAAFSSPGISNQLGTGTSTIAVGATIEIAAAASGSVTFDGSTGSLILDHSSMFSGEVFNFTGDGSLAGSDHIDLRDIHDGSIQDSYANGVLTVTDGINTATLNFAGSYTLENFKFASDGNGGTIVYDPPVPAPNPSLAASSGAATGAQAGGTTDHVTIPAPAANAILTGNGGNDTFVFKPNFGQAAVTNFAPATDVIQFDHVVFADSAAALAAARDNGQGDVVITDASHDTITLHHLAVTQLHQSDFHIT
jgi:hypothetical protein